MKKVINYLLIIFMFFSCTIQIKAIKLTQEEYEEFNIRRAYIVGEYIFDLSEHNPTLKDLMLAAQSSEFGDVSIIEIKIAENLGGELTKEYRELLSSKTLTQFPTLDVKYIYMSNIMPDNPEKENKIVLTKLVYGDANEDGVVDVRDSLKIERYLSPDFDETLTEQGIKNADVNNDGKVDYIDPILISRYVAGWYDEEDTLPDNPITDYKMFGDANEDGIVDLVDVLDLMEYISSGNNLTEQGIKNADVNDDDKVNSLDSLLLMQYNSGWYEVSLPASPITDYTVYGDVNNDCVTDGKDAIRLSKYLNGNVTLDYQGEKNADVNGDGSINQTDYDVLLEYLVDNDSSVPLSPLS